MPVPEPALVPPAPAREALTEGRWSEAVGALRAWPADGLRGPELADRAFLLAWASVRAGEAEAASRWIGAFDGVSRAPAVWQDQAVGEILAAQRRDEEALARLAEVPATHPLGARARAVEAGILRRLGRTKESSARWQEIVSRPDPSPGNAEALRVLAERRGVGTEASRGYLRRLWQHYPTTEEGRWARASLASRYPEESPSWQEVTGRAEALMAQGAWDDVLEETSEIVAQAERGTVDGCRVAYARARSMYKRNRLTDMLNFLGDDGGWCPRGDGAEGPGHKIRYLQGMAATRLKDFEAAARHYEAIHDDYPHTTYADDGLTRAGLSHLEMGDVEGALARWRLALERYPAGDTVPEAIFRVAFTLWEQGDAGQAIDIAAKLAALAPSLDEVHVLAGRYWSARWQAWPDPQARSTPDNEAQARATESFRALATQAPHHLYGAMAFARLAQLSPLTASGLIAERSDAPIDLSMWALREDWIEDPAVEEGVSLMRVGLVEQGLARVMQAGSPTPAEHAWLARLQQAAGDPVGAHIRMHDLLREVSAVSLGAARDRVLAVALPDLYGDEIRASVADKDVPARFFHAIVREESRFQKDIRSWAGAKGLAQIMPATARDVARRSGLPARDLSDPAQNLPLGAWYLDHLLGRYGGVPQMAMAAYNAGPGNANRWVAERGGVPLDVFIERIPFRETRGYVKRVSSTWQAYRWVHDREQPPYLDLRAALAHTPGGDRDTSGP